MQYLHKFGPGEYEKIQAHLDSGHPEKMASAAKAMAAIAPEGAPEFDEETRLYWRAFELLSTDRPLGMGARGPIPWTAIDRFAHRHGINDPFEFDTLVYVISRLDAAYLADQNDKGSGAAD